MKSVSVQCRDLRMSYGSTPVLQGISLDVAPGEFFALLGPSGSGKSTLLRLIAGFNRQQSGELRVDGVDISAQEPWQRQVGMVFQNYALWPHLSVADNVAFGLVERRVDKAQIQRRVAAALDLVGLGALAARHPHQLSGGQQQRVALARTLVIEPQVLLLDEPLSNLDKSLRVQMRQELLAMQRRLGLTTLFVTHDQEEAMTTADRMAVLDQGVLQQVGTPRALYDEPANAFVASFVGTMNLLPATVRSVRNDLAEFDVAGLGAMTLPCQAPVAPAQVVQLGFRPHALSLVDPHAAATTPGLLPLDGEVLASEFLGASIRYRVRAASHELWVDQARQAGRDPRPVGAAVRVELDLRQGRVLAA